MGKRIAQQRRGRGTRKYKVRRKAYSIKLGYPNIVGKGEVKKILSTPAHSSPIALIKIGKTNFFNVATNGLYEKQTIEMGEKAPLKSGNILPLGAIPIGTNICNIETIPYGGGKIVRSSGISAKVHKKISKGVVILLPSKKEKLLSKKSRATIGINAGGGRVDKPLLKAGKVWHMMSSRGKPYPSTSPVKMNVVSHPFGCGRGKNMGKPSTAPRNAPPGRKVGLIRASRTGRKKKK